MYIIFESNEFQNAINNKTTDATLNDPNITPESEPVPIGADPNVAPDFEPESGPELQAQNGGLEIDPLKLQAIQKYILYQRLREIQYSLEDSFYVKNSASQTEIDTFTRFLNHVISFFEVFTYTEALQLFNHILNIFKRINPNV